MATLIAHWPMDDFAADTTVKDVGGNGLDGTADANTDTLSVDWLCGQAFALDGEEITVATNPSMVFSSGGQDLPFSVAFAVNAATLNPKGIFGRRGVVSVGIYQSGLIYAIHGAGLPNYLSIYLVDTIMVGRWHSVAITYDGSGDVSGIRVYVDGVEVDVARHTRGTYVAMADTEYDWTLGGSYSLVYQNTMATGAPSFVGSLADFRVYSGVLSRMEILRLHAGHLSPALLADALVRAQAAPVSGFGGGFGGQGLWVPSASRMIRGFAFDLSVVAATPKVSSGTPGEPVDTESKDRRIRTITYTGAETSTRWQCSTPPTNHNPDWSTTKIDPEVTLEISDETKSTINEDGLTDFVADGPFFVIATAEATDYSSERRVSAKVTNVTSAVESYDEVTYLGGVVGSAREDADDAIDDAIAISQDTAIFTTLDHATPTYVRNASCWAAGFDLTCFMAWNSRGAGQRGGPLISNRHFIFTKHFPLYAGDLVRYVQADGTVVERTILGTQLASGDLSVAVLDEAVVGCGLAMVLPADYADYLPDGGTEIPVFCVDQEKKAVVRDLSDLAYEHYDGYTHVKCQLPTDATRLLCYEPMVLYDSSSAIVMGIDGDLVVLGVVKYGGSGIGQALHAYLDEINAAMAALDTANGFTPDKTLTEVDLSGYTDFS